jgi:peptidyl-prolyl cis-trans isomerase C
MKRLFVLAALGWAVLFVSCSRNSDDNRKIGSADEMRSDNPVLAVVGDRRITGKDFQAELERRSRFNHETYPNAQQRQKLLQEMVRFEVLLAQAKSAGYDRKPEVRARVNEFIVARFQEDQLAKQAAPKPSQTEMQRFYEQHQEQFTTPAEVRIALIYFKCSSKATEEKWQELKGRAESVLAEAQTRDAEGFKRLAQQHSDDQVTRYSGGDAGWLQQKAAGSRWDAAVVKAAFAIPEPGEFAPLVETANGFYIVRLLQKKAGGFRPFEQVQEVIAYQLSRQQQYQQQQNLFEEMKRGLKVEVHPEALESISTPERAADAGPPPMPRS